MRPLLPVFFLLCTCWTVIGQEKPVPAPRPEPPRNLEEAHQQMETLLSKDDLARIDAMKSEKEMVDFNLSVGLAIRDNWGLWGGSPLAMHLWQLGFEHSEDMSTVILQTFWCRRHHRSFRLEDRADYFRVYWKAAAEPPPTAKDPDDGAEVEWAMSFSAGNDERPRQVHVGRSKRTGRWLAYEYNKGVYEPDKALTAKIKAFTSDPFAASK